MQKITHILLTSLCILSLETSVAQENQSDYDVQEWSAPGVLGLALINLQSRFPNIEVNGWNVDWQLNREASYCKITVRRPKRGLPAIKDEQNMLHCLLFDSQEDREATVNLSLRDVEVLSWGNRASESHWQRNGLPKVFQFLNQDINLAMHSALRRTREAGESSIYRQHVSGPNGIRHTNAYSLGNGPAGPDSNSYLSCTIESSINPRTEEISIYQTRCTFYFPESH